MLGRFAALENFCGGGDGNVDISRVWEGIRENMKASGTERIGYYELKELKPWFDEEC
jgi:hypothetical protein